MLYLQLYLDFKILKREEFCHEREINEFQVTLLAKSEMPDKQHLEIVDNYFVSLVSGKLVSGSLRTIVF